MKFFYIYLIVLWSNLIICQTYVGDVTLTSQAEIDSFGSNNYVHIDGNLIIEYTGDNPDITSLQSLSSLVSISNNLELNANLNLLNSLNGLNNLTSIGNDFRLNIHGIESLTELSALNNIGGSLNINSNSLKNLNGLQGVTQIPGTLSILSVPLNDFNGLNNLTSVGGLYVLNNYSLISFDGLENLDTAGFIFAQLNNNLTNYCSLFNLVNNNGITGGYNVSQNAYNPSIQDILNNDCSNGQNNNVVTLPKENSYFNSSDIHVKLSSSIGIPNSSLISVFYSFDQGLSWIYDNQYLFNSFQNSFIWSSVDVSEPKNIKLRLLINLPNNQQLELLSNSFSIQPINYYQNLGFINNGTSQFDTPLQGLFSTTDGWFTLNNSIAHNCLDGNAQDWYSYLFQLACGMDVRAPFDSKILKIVSEDSSNSCGIGNSGGSYAKQIILQSSDDKTMAFRFAHLFSLREELIEGMSISKGDLIGKVGGSGITNVHLHASLYKNIYNYLEVDFSENGGEITNTLEELLISGNSITSLQTEGCQIIEDNFSAEFSFINDLTVEEDITVILSNIMLNDLILLGINSFNQDLIFGNYSEDILNSLNSENYITAINSLIGLESVYSISGDLIISNTNISNLEGLNNLTHIGGDLVIVNNSNLNDFCGLFELIKNDGIGGSIIIQDNQSNPTFDNILNDLDCDSNLYTSDFEEYSTLIYPNPSSNFIYIENTNNIDLNLISIYDINGRLVKQISNTNKIDIKDLNTGVYILTLVLKSGDKKSIKIIKK